MITPYDAIVEDHEARANTMPLHLCTLYWLLLSSKRASGAGENVVETAEIVDDLQAALDQFAAIAGELRSGLPD